MMGKDNPNVVVEEDVGWRVSIRPNDSQERERLVITGWKKGKLVTIRIEGGDGAAIPYCVEDLVHALTKVRFLSEHVATRGGE